MRFCVLDVCVMPLCVLPFSVMLFLRDTYMIVAFLVFLPFNVVFVLPTLTRYTLDLT